MFQPSKDKAEEKPSVDAVQLSESQGKSLTDWAKSVLDVKVTDVKV